MRVALVDTGLGNPLQATKLRYQCFAALWADTFDFLQT